MDQVPPNFPNSAKIDDHEGTLNSEQPLAPKGSRQKVKLVVSDFHLGKGRYFRDGTQNILEDFVYDREFSEFLNYYRTGDYADVDVELVLNGDILNLLQIDNYGIHTHLFTEKSVTRAVEKIIRGHPDFFLALRRFAATEGHTVVYIVGNHDAGMLWPQARKAFQDAIGAPVTFYDVSYVSDGIYIEHGQQYESFAKMDMQRPFITRGLPEPVLNLPWGSLFVAILMPKMKQERPHVDKVRPFQLFLRWIIIHDLWWGLKTAARIIKFVFDTMLFRRRYQIHQGVGSTLDMLKEISIYPNYDKVAFNILEEREDIHTVIFGHTHILRYRQWREGKEYFNEGTWNETTNLFFDDYGRQSRLSYGYIEYPSLETNSVSTGITSMHTGVISTSKALRPKVRLKQWHGVWKPEVELIA